MSSIEHKLKKVEFPNDPKRCQANVKQGQCPFEALDNFNYCKMHARGFTETKKEQDGIRNYRLGQWQGRVNELADNQQVKSLREEVGVLRMTLEALMLRCQDSNDILIFANKISDLVLKIEKVVSSCHRLEMSAGSLLDKSSILQIAGVIVETISRHIEDQDVVSIISEEIFLTITETKIQP